MNLSAYDTINNKIDKTKSWIDVKKRVLLSREIKYRKFYSFAKRYDKNNSCYNYYIILLDNPQDQFGYYSTKFDDYGRIKIKLNEIYNDINLNSLNKNTNIIIKNIEHEEDGDIYEIVI